MARRTAPWWGLVARLAALLMMTGALAPTAAHANSTERYIMGDLGPVPGATHFVPSGPFCGVNYVCFGPTQGRIRVKIDDDSGRRVGGVIIVYGGPGPDRRHTPFCGSSSIVRLLPGDLLYVFLDGAGDTAPGGLHWSGWDHGPGCAEIAGLTTLGATSGTVTVSYLG